MCITKYSTDWYHVFITLGRDKNYSALTVTEVFTLFNQKKNLTCKSYVTTLDLDTGWLFDISS